MRGMVSYLGHDSITLEVAVLTVSDGNILFVTLGTDYSLH